MGWKSFINKLKSGSQADVVGLGICPDGIAYAQLGTGDAGAVLKDCDFLLNLDGEQPLEQLKGRIQENNLQGAMCRVALPPNLYSLLLIEAPKVPDSELREASRWKVKDLLSYPLDEALIDVFPLPPESTKGRNMVYAVAVREEEVRKVMDMVDSAGLKLASIDIIELTMRNLVEATSDEERGVGLVYLKQNRGLLTLMKGANVYLSRQFDINYNAGLFDDLPEEQLILELQRSLDYYERQMGQVPPGKLLICGENVTEDKITDGLQNAFAASVTVLDVSGLPGANQWDESILGSALPALGAVLRGSGVVAEKQPSALGASTEGAA